MLHRARLLVFVLASFLSLSAVASAEIVLFSSGRTMSIKEHQDAADGRLVLVLRGGGQVVCEKSQIDRIVPDEMPQPEETAAPTVGDQRAVPPEYAKLIDATAARHGVDPKLVRAVIQVESAYRAQARSRKGAMGLMQLMPDTAKRFEVKNPYDPRANIEGGIKYLKFLLDRFDGVALAVAAYNAGESAVDRFRGVPPYAETRNYVDAVLKLTGSRH